MASTTSVLQADNISKDEFESLLSQYPDLIKSVSDSKRAKDSQKTLQELDSYRYDEALKIFSTDKQQRSMNLDDVKMLVEWKLRHGKFRPTLMKLVTSNDPAVAKDIIQQALDGYRKDADAQAALDTLTKLRGIGPATASLLLTVHDPNDVIFFSDEAFYWLCCNGKKSPIKYNAKEYRALRDSAQDLSKRLGVSATDVEKVAYVLMKQSDLAPEPEKAKTAKKVATSSSKEPKEPKGPKEPKEAKKNTKTSSTKRKPDADPGNTEGITPETTTLRRSKRTRA
ncbi:hypothetical protein EDB81DRAFT_382208 [Dactylonectria macrodidyma]|uniref:Uncharacterized protein n=1 Tax=Dactylonectria macrodidyma TaxID=307937 RepID=A0A9P9F8Q4_9HYPO|nr:hypothetical protein EDB81DRAFT_382208 [Dactylonectria macrodidyma]